jgi:SAM-dependent methyltransferase
MQLTMSNSGAAVQVGGRRDGYYQQARPEVAELVPAECRRVLDVGCGGGELSRLLQKRGHVVSGVELVPEAAAAARQHLERVEVADVEADGFPFPPGSFDALVFADVLEHFVDPWRVLREAVPLLAPGGRVVVSVPNLQNWRVLRRLLLGKWEYRERGITDFGHLRFFTAATLRGLFASTGLAVTHLGYHYRRTFGRALANVLTFGKARPYLARQLLAVARRV